MPDLYRCAPLSRSSLGSSHELVHSQWTGMLTTLSSAVCEVAASCSRFNTIGSHAENIIRATGGSRPPDILPTLAGLVENGILVPFEALRRLAAQRGQPGLAISWLAIPTCGRPEALGRALQSYAANAAGLGGRHAFLVADDSPGSAERRVNRRIACSIWAKSTHPNSPLFYMGRPERARYARALSGKGCIPKDVAQFALLGSGSEGRTYGANRNAILLHTQGSSILSVDDDTSCVPGVVPGVNRGPRIHSHGDPFQLWFFRNRSSATEFASPAHLNVAAEHGSLLGANLVAALGGAGNFDSRLPFILNEACPHMWLSLCAGKDRILMTTNGMAGDSGMTDTAYAARMSSDHGTRHRLALPSAYRAALTSREIVRQSPTVTVSHTGPVMATSIGLDNRVLLPPFFPEYRNEDGVFGQVLSQCFPHGYAAYLPFVLRHIPAVRRSRANSSVAGIRFSHVVLACLSTWPGAPMVLSEASRMRSLGRYLIELGSLPIDDFFDFVRMPLWSHTAAAIVSCKSLLARYPPPPRDPWGADLRANLRQLQQSLTSLERPLPSDLRGNRPPESASQATRDLIRRYGELLFWWPDIAERAKALSDRGCSLANEIDSGSGK